MKFEGTYVAMVTPFLKDGTIDEEGFRARIIESVVLGENYNGKK